MIVVSCSAAGTRDASEHGWHCWQGHTGKAQLSCSMHTGTQTIERQLPRAGSPTSHYASCLLPFTTLHVRLLWEDSTIVSKLITDRHFCLKGTNSNYRYRIVLPEEANATTETDLWKCWQKTLLADTDSPFNSTYFRCTYRLQAQNKLILQSFWLQRYDPC